MGHRAQLDLSIAQSTPIGGMRQHKPVGAGFSLWSALLAGLAPDPIGPQLQIPAVNDGELRGMDHRGSFPREQMRILRITSSGGVISS
jgi:hypothetical protein